VRGWGKGKGGNVRWVERKRKREWLRKEKVETNEVASPYSSI
jgi:hypothetical protein